MAKYIYYILLFLFIGHQLPAQILNDDLLLYYPFNGNSNDESDHGFHGVSNATLVSDRAGNEESAYYFNGMTSYIEIPNENDLKPDFPFAISLWFRVEEFNGGTRVLFTNDEDLSGNVYSGFWLLYNSSGRVSAGYGNAISQSPAGRVTKHANQSIITGEWYHVVASFNTLNDIDLYINCELDEGYYTGSANSLVYLNLTGAVGRDLGQHFGSSNHKGEIDDVRFFSTSLVEEDVLVLCAETPTATVFNIENEHNFMTIYPNPTNGILNIKFATDLIETKISDVRLINSLGEIVFTKKISKNTTQINLEKRINKGFYFLQILDSDAKILINKKLIFN